MSTGVADGEVETSHPNSTEPFSLPKVPEAVSMELPANDEGDSNIMHTSHALSRLPWKSTKQVNTQHTTNAISDHAHDDALTSERLIEPCPPYTEAGSGYEGAPSLDPRHSGQVARLSADGMRWHVNEQVDHICNPECATEDTSGHHGVLTPGGWPC